MTSIEVRAHAKVNLLLKVLGKRKDSYHDLYTIFERISVCDKIKISKIPQKGIVLHSNKFITKDPHDNLIYKAARIILDKRHIDRGVKIYIEKEIPIAAGLGGGSSDAAAVLIGINRLFGLNINKKTLMKWGSGLGADVPFFLMDASFAIGTGIGDRLKEVKSKKLFWHLLINPGFAVSTQEIYRSLDLDSIRRQSEGSKSLTRPKGNAKIGSPLGKTMDFCAVEAMLYNDLQSVVISKKGVIGNIIRRLATLLDKKAIVSGSGPSVFCLYRSRKEAELARRQLLDGVPARQRRDWQVIVARTC